MSLILEMIPFLNYSCGSWIEVSFNLVWQKITNVRDFEQNWPGNTAVYLVLDLKLKLNFGSPLCLDDLTRKERNGRVARRQIYAGNFLKTDLQAENQTMSYFVFDIPLDDRARKCFNGGFSSAIINTSFYRFASYSIKL